MLGEYNKSELVILKVVVGKPPQNWKIYFHSSKVNLKSCVEKNI